ncbi:citrate/2-methylcitrate synthase [Clostridium sp. WILCCON 0269]|uniref:Citrate synthase n=1 Tax=Candidatus Clostridium eludens TaxID=3381663 RepID=A0ABW8SIL8_9CLOT
MDNMNLEEFERGLSKKLKNSIDPELYNKYQVKRGLRDADGRGVLVGLTEIGEVHSYIIDENEVIPIPGTLMYRGINIQYIVNGFLKDDRFGFEEVGYLLLFGELPNKKELDDFTKLLSKYRNLPEDFVRDMILKMPSKNIMNSMARSVLALYSIDDNADSTSIDNVLKQCIRLIAYFPLIGVYGYHAFSHYHKNKSLIIHSPQPNLSTAENILYMLRNDSKYTKLEAKLLDLALVLHAEHGGGNNSSFVTHVVTSSGSDTYSVTAAALGSLKGPRHGGANLKVVEMFDNMKQNLKDWNDDEKIKDYLMKLLNKEAFDRSGLIYGIGHAVYSISDPRAVIFKEYVEKLAKEKGLEAEYNLYAKVEKLASELMKAKVHKDVSANVDFYSGFVYRMLDIPIEMFTPIFAISRIVGWSAHRIEEIINNGKIVRPAFKCVSKRRKYIPLENRTSNF